MFTTLPPTGQGKPSPQALLDYFGHCPDKPAIPAHLRFHGGGVYGQYGSVSLHSVFQPLLDTASWTPLAHEALLRGRDEAGTALSPAQVFQLPTSSEHVAFLDRLCRTAHAYNFAAQAAPDDVLYLNIHGRHLLAADSGSHGRTFESLLHHCGLRPTQVVLEILESDITGDQRLEEAVAAYQERGFRIAIDDFGSSHSNFDRLWRLTPDIVKLDREMMVQAIANPRARTILPKLIEILHDLEAQVVCEGIETEDQHALAADSGADMVQGFLYARPQAALFRQGERRLATAG